MRKHLLITYKYMLLAGLTILTLSACGKPLESPEAVMNKAKQAIVDVSSGSVTITADATGKNGSDDLLFKGGAELTFDKKDEENQKMDLHLTLSGDIKAGEKELNGDLDVNFMTVDKQYYVKLDKLFSSDDSLTNLQPFIDLYSGKWLRIDETFIPENIRNLQAEDEAAKLKKKQLEELFVETPLFNVVKEYSVEKLNGKKVYHYGLAVNMEGFKDYMAKAAVIDGRELTTQEIEDAVKVLNYVKQADIYVDVNDYYILKSVFRFTGEALSEKDANLEVEITVEGSDFNQSVSIKAPEEAEDFNPLNLVMGLGGVPTLPATADEPADSEKSGKLNGVTEDPGTNDGATDDEVTVAE